nr:cupin domain-containing protein [Baekduia alba]
MSEAPIVLTRGSDVLTQTAQTEGARRLLGVGAATGASRIWMGRVENAPGEWSAPHHHGEAETGGFVLSGRARIYFGADYSEFIDMGAGDFCFVPPFVPHIEGNMSDTEPLVYITARTPDNIVVNLPGPGRDVHADTLRAGRS